MNVIETLKPEHLTRFSPDKESVGEIRQDQFGKAAVLISDGKLISICMIFEYEDGVMLCASMSEDAIQYPFALHRSTLLLIKGLKNMGYKKIVAASRSPHSDKWLERLGFSPKENQKYGTLKEYQLW